MAEYQQIISIIALTMGVAWASGINLYATILVLGISANNGQLVLPDSLYLLQSPLVIAAAGLMFAVEFFADKVPGVDSIWDAIHTFIRIPAGALLAAGVVVEISPALALAAALVGGGLTATTHASKTGTRLIINTSPEPFSNWTLSVTEDLLVIAGLWAALTHPLLFCLLLFLFILFLAWLLPRLWHGIRRLRQKINAYFRHDNRPTLPKV